MRIRQKKGVLRQNCLYLRNMKYVSILVPESAIMRAVADPHQLFSEANNFLAASGKPPLFHIELVGAKKEVKLNNGLYTVHTDKRLKDIKKTDLVLIPPLFGDMETALSINRKLPPWINEQYKNGAEVASLCVGAFLLASTGLLNGKKCSTHWAFQNEFRFMFPEVEMVDGSVITEELGIYSSGGANSYWTLLLHLLEKYTDRATAILASKYFAVDIDRASQAAFAMFRGQKNHGDQAINKAQEYIEQHLQEKISIDDLADIAVVGRRNFERRFKQATNNSVSEYIHRVKIEAAKRQFENSRKNINEVMNDIGYSDSKAFRSMFKKLTGLTPTKYRNKYNKMAIQD